MNGHRIRVLLILLFTGILTAMIAVTTYASLDRSLFDLRPQLTSDPWFHATLADAYFGFLTFFVWVAYKESSLSRKIVWLVLIMAFGNIAMSTYVLIQLWKWRPESGIQAFFAPNRIATG